MSLRPRNDNGDSDWKTLILDTLKGKKKLMSSAVTTTTATTTANITTTLKSTCINRAVNQVTKARAIHYLQQLNTVDKWKLRSGRYVEDGVLEAVKESSFRHPCLSYILDLADSIWQNYFTSEEFVELKTDNSVKLPAIINDLQAYINAYDSGDLNTAADYYAFASKQFLDFDGSFGNVGLKNP